jgi:molecular chaperone IbpA
MRTYDLTPLMRSTIGFDRFDRLFEQAFQHADSGSSYPPYNIEKRGEDAYRISMAVAGFGEDDLDITVKENSVTISGKPLAEEADTSFLHKGIARRGFERRFDLADHIKVTGANLENGLLHVDLVREIPEAKRPRRINIATDTPAAKVIDEKAA